MLRIAVEENEFVSQIFKGRESQVIKGDRASQIRRRRLPVGEVSGVGGEASGDPLLSPIDGQRASL